MELLRGVARALDGRHSPVVHMFAAELIQQCMVGLCNTSLRMTCITLNGAIGTSIIVSMLGWTYNQHSAYYCTCASYY